MVEREQGRGRQDDEAEVGHPVVPSDVAIALGKPEPDDEASEFERVMEIGRKVMSDHHAVLAALAK